MSSGEPPIFVVGVPRSGTTLLAAMLGAHSRLSCGTETDFFHFLAQADAARLLDPRTWPEAAADFLFAMVQARGKKPVPVHYGLDRDAVRAYLRVREPSLQSMLEAVTGQYMAANGKHRWVEKTPRHLLHLPAIRRCYPRAPIIRIVRDPRDVALSLLKADWQWAPHSYAGALFLWKYCDERSAGFFAADRVSYTLHYERLIEDPERELRALCAALGEEFEDAMLDTRASYRDVNSIAEPWKAKVGQPVDHTRIEVWRRELDEAGQRQAECLAGDGLRAYGYPHGDPGAGYAEVFPLDGLLRYPQVCAWLVRSGARIWRTSEREAPRRIVFIGDPEADLWLGHTGAERVRSTIAVARRALEAKIMRRDLLWFRMEGADAQPGVLAGLLGQALRRSAVLEQAGDRDETAVRWRANLNQQPKIGALAPA